MINAMLITYLLPAVLTLSTSVSVDEASSCDELKGRERTLCRIEQKLDRVITCNITEARNEVENMYCTLKTQVDREPSPDSSRRTEMRLKEMQQRMRGVLPVEERKKKTERNFVRGQVHKAATTRSRFLNARTNRRIGKQEFPGRFRPADKEEARKSLKRYGRATTDLESLSGQKRVRVRVDRDERSVRGRKSSAERMIRLFRARAKKVPPIRQ